MPMIKEPRYEPALPKERAGKSLLSTVIMQLRWLIRGPKYRRRGWWVFNSRDETWRYYLDDIRAE